MGTTDISLERIFKQLIAGNVGLAIAETETYLSAWPNPQTKERLDVMKEEYQLMEGYWRQGVSDPQRHLQYQKLLQRVYVLCANIAIHRHLSASSYLQGVYQQVRQSEYTWSLDAIRQELEGFVTDVAMLELEPENLRKERGQQIYKQHQQQMNALFNYIVTSRIWTEGVGKTMEALLLSPTVDVKDQQLLVSAVMLSLMNRFDMVKFRLLVSVYRQSLAEEVRQRALVGWVLGIDDDFVDIYPKQRELVADLLQSEQVCRELTELQIQLVYALNVEEDSKEVSDVIMSNLKNGGFRMTPKGLEEVEEDELEDALHPDAEERRMEQLEANAKRLMDMQKQGTDIFFSGFSQIKRYPFFYDMSNWLVPFYMQHPDIAQYVGRLEDNRMVDKLLNKGPFCNNDKYSLLIAMQQVINNLPAEMRKMFQSGEVSPMEFEPSRSEYSDPAYIRRNYLMDLYRFFKLFPNRSALCNPFDTAKNELGMCLFFGSELFRTTPLEAYKREVVALLLKKNHQTAAQQLLDTFPQEMRDVQYFLWTKQFAEALELEPDNVRALVGHARWSYENGFYEDALTDYDRLLLLNPGKTGYMLNKAVCQVELKDYDEALQSLFQLNYEHPDDQRVNRVLAWTLTCAGKLEQADRVYQQVLAGEHAAQEDKTNYGYCLWLQGRVDEAVRLLKGCNRLDDAWLREHGIGRVETMMMQAAING